MANAPGHTYGAKCRLAPVQRAPKDDGLPPVEAQFFYSSVIPIDDPLSTSAALGTADSRSNKSQLRPFSRGDNNALEKAWLSLASDEDRADHENARNNREQSESAVQKTWEKRSRIVEAVAMKHIEKHPGQVQTHEVSLPVDDGLPTTPMPACCSELLLDVSEALLRVFCSLLRRTTKDLEPQAVLQDVTSAMSRLRQASTTDNSNPTIESEGIPSDPVNIKIQHPADKWRANVEDEHKGRARSASQPMHRPSKLHTRFGSPSPVRPPPTDDGISGRPFVRVETEGVSLSSSPAKAGSSVPPSPAQASFPTKTPVTQSVKAAQTLKEMEMEHAGKSPARDDKEVPDTILDVAVGVSRLHMVSLPMLQMKPIYWSPVNDMAVVTRATWFYR